MTLKNDDKIKNKIDYQTTLNIIKTKHSIEYINFFEKAEGNQNKLQQHGKN